MAKKVYSISENLIMGGFRFIIIVIVAVVVNDMLFGQVGVVVVVPAFSVVVAVEVVVAEVVVAAVLVVFVIVVIAVIFVIFASSIWARFAFVPRKISLCHPYTAITHFSCILVDSWRGIFKGISFRIFQRLAHRVTHRIQHFWLPTRSHFAFSSLPTHPSRVLRDSAPRYVGWSVGWSVAFLGSGPEGPLACRT